MSIRVYDDKDMLVAAELAKGEKVAQLAGEMLADERAKFINVHNAVPGCFAFRVERA